jgi:FkbM family methyltransferase
MTRNPPTRSATQAVGIFLARRRRNVLVRKVAGLCQRYLGWYSNLNYDLLTNGESFVLQQLGTFKPRVLFDVGANIGDWSLEAKKHCPNADVHAFEIAAPTFETLVANTSGLSGMHSRMAGLSDVEGAIRIRYYAALPALTTSADYPHPLAFTELEGKVITGDSYATQNGIGHIDLLKIDVEGMEEKVLTGFGEMFARRAIDLVQFEYGRVSIVTRFLLRDFHAFFRERGYVVGKIFPNYVDFRDYELADEDFLGPNYLACLKDRTDYLRTFGSSAIRSRG